MFDLIILSLVLYALVAYVRRKIAKPNYQDKVVWITGASSGIGEALAYEFNRLGAHLILSARNLQELQRVQQTCSAPERVEVVKMDMTNYGELEKGTREVLERLEAQGKRLDVVVENAGVSMRCEFKDYAFENHQALFDVNVHGPY